MVDLVDYLREKLKPRCTCAQADVCDLTTHLGHENPHATMRGRTDPGCSLHGEGDAWAVICPTCGTRISMTNIEEHAKWHEPDPLSHLTPEEIDIIADTVRRRREE